MYFITFFLALAALVNLSFSAPRNTKAADATECGQWDLITTGSFTLYQDLWNEDSGSGSQCTAVDSLSNNGNTLAWHTEWNWNEGPTTAKSYANAVGNLTSKPLNQLSSVSTSWAFSYTGSNVVGDISFDIYFGHAATGQASYEVMIWLTTIGGAFPLSYSNEAVATLTIAGTGFQLFKGPHGGNGATTIFTFVADVDQSSYSGDMLAFFDYLEETQGVSSDLYLQSIGAGMEAFTGSNVNFLTTSYEFSVY